MVRRMTRVFLSKPLIQKAIKKQIKEDQSIVIGQRSINRQTGILSRPTKDWDIFDDKPKKSAQKAEKEFDSIVGFDYFFVKKGKNPGTWKVKGKGDDMIKNTKDDVGILDVTKTPKPMPKTISVGGIRYRSLKEEIKGKRATQKDPKFKFRKYKDKEDLKRLTSFKKLSMVNKLRKLK